MKPYPPAVLKVITEEQWQDTVTGLATMTGWNWWHDNDPRRNKAGLPDLMLWKPGQFMLVELKKETGKTTEIQDMVLRGLDNAGVETHVWRPSQLVDVERRLRTR